MLLITKRDELWRLTFVGIPDAIAKPSRKQCLVRLARILGSKCGHTIYVYNEAGHLESMRTFPQAIG